MPREFSNLTSIFEKCEKIYEFKSASSVSPVYLYDNKVLIALCPLGGPASANLMEELIFVGIKDFLAVGSCGAITEVDLNQYFVPNRAIRDEGCSYHYIRPSKFVETSKKLTTKIAKVLKKHKEKYYDGTIWTTDALYRETQGRIKARIADGAKGVEMETASLCAVAQAKNVDFACLLYFSDYNNGQLWQTRFYDKYELRTKIVNYAVEILLSK